MTEFNASIPLEWRQSASQSLLELADSMARGAISLSRKSARIMDPDPKVQWRVIGTLRSYTNSSMPCSDEMYRIEALLTGTPEDQCKSVAEKKRAERLEGRRIRDEQWQRIMDSKNAYEAHQKMFALTRKKPVPARSNGNVVTGPWDKGETA